MDELVFAIPTVELWKLTTYAEKGLVSCSGDVLKAIVLKGQFRKRDKSEEDPSFKQIITYAVISFKDSFYLFRRSSGQKEKRLQNKYSLGVGGHINPGRSTRSAEKFFVDELKREFFEEVRLMNSCSIEKIDFIGLLNDDSIPVGRVHIGLLFSIHLSDRDIAISETDKMTAAWIDKADLAEFYDEMESWSRFILDRYIK